MLSSNQQMHFASGYQAAMEEIYRIINNADTPHDALYETLTYVRDALGK